MNISSPNFVRGIFLFTILGFIILSIPEARSQRLEAHFEQQNREILLSVLAPEQIALKVQESSDLSGWLDLTDDQVPVFSGDQVRAPGATRHAYYRVLPAAKMAPPPPLPTNDIFFPFLTRTPQITARISETMVDGIRVERVRFSSFEGTSEGGLNTNEIYAVIAQPAESAVKSRPGVLLCHGGGSTAMEYMAIHWAKLGFVAISPELPAWADVPSMQSISRYPAFSGSYWGAAPNARAAPIFDTVVAGLGAFNLLSSHRDVAPGKVSITGASFGGYLVTMLCGLLDVRVERAFSIFGSAYFLETAWKGHLLLNPEAEREEFLRNLDAGARIGRIRAAWMCYAASNDIFFPPPAINKTFETVPGEKYLCFSPNDNHVFNLRGGETDGSAWTTMERVFFTSNSDRKPLPKIYPLPRTGRTVSIAIAGLPADHFPFVYYSTNLTASWTERQWNRLNSRPTASGFAFDFDPRIEVVDWFAGLSFEFKTSAVTNVVSLSTKIFRDDLSQ